MKKLTGNEIRKLFLSYFEQKQHMVEPSASLVPYQDNTLLWINSGVAALKKYFDGSVKPKCNRITNAQKSIRANDIENVGYTARHHTFFEMLGNFSIGDYFKKEAIHFAWEFLTAEKYIGFDKEKLYITVHSDDNEAYRIWTEEIGVNPNKILKTEHNFWQIGEGPSGPNSEIFYDRGKKYDPENLGEKLFFDELENDRYIEVWNIVFSQYDAKEGVDRKDFKELPQKNIDTGMGLERLVCIVQDVETNFDTDLFMPIILKTEAFTTQKYANEDRFAYRVIADHIRTLVFALADGAAFSNEGRGYVLRRILRRAVRFGKKLNINKPFLFELVQTVNEIMEDFYPNLKPKLSQIEKLIKQEEEKFHITLQDGEKLLVQMITSKQTLTGEDTFKLYDTYGFPFELTQEVAKEYNVNVDKKAFEEEMEKQRLKARQSRNEQASFNSQSQDLLNFTTESEFIGYDTLQTKAKVIGIFVDGVSKQCASGEVGLIFDKTCFYATSGGQEFDKGDIVFHNKKYPVQEVIKSVHKQHLHKVNIDEIQIGDEVELVVDVVKREDTSKNHSATHLLQLALKKFVGNHVAQAGSFYNEDYLRFDFTHFEKITSEQLKQIEDFVNTQIQEAHETMIEYMELEKAKQTGANALFDEKYGDIVRVVTMGDSKELCGGTHVANTKDIQHFKVESEESVGSGIRRISAITANKVMQKLLQQADTLSNVVTALQIQNEAQVLSKITTLNEELVQLKKENAQLQQKLAVQRVDSLIKNSKQINGNTMIIEKFENVGVDVLKQMIDVIKSKITNYFVYFASIVDDKLMLVSGTDIKEIHCGNIIKETAMMANGNGGGKPTLATAGSKDVSKINEVIQFVKEKMEV